MGKFNLDLDPAHNLNRVSSDKYGRIGGILAIDKPPKYTSHDIVDIVRKKLGTRKVGHAGALDPFASGVLIILVGKKFTKYSDLFIKFDKKYRAEVLFGIETDSFDVEGNITSRSDFSNFNIEDVKSKIHTYEGEFEQHVPVFSSTKVDGQKLRVLARKSETFDIREEDNNRKIVVFKFKDGKNKEVELPTKVINLDSVEFIDGKMVDLEKVVSIDSLQDAFIKRHEIKGKYPLVTLDIACSKGTYIRQLAADIAKDFDQKGTLLNLRRVSVGEIDVQNCIQIDDIPVRD